GQQPLVALRSFVIRQLWKKFFRHGYQKIRISTQPGKKPAWSTVNPISWVIDDTTCCSRTISSRLYDTCTDVLRLGSVIIDSYDVATGDDEVDRVAFFYSDPLGYDYVINTHAHRRVTKQPIQRRSLEVIFIRIPQAETDGNIVPVIFIIGRCQGSSHGDALKN